MALASITKPDGIAQQSESVVQGSQTANAGIGSSQSNPEEAAPEVVDPLAHMSDSDKWGLKGFTYLMNNFPDYAALVMGSDLSALGFDLNSAE